MAINLLEITAWPAALVGTRLNFLSFRTKVAMLTRSFYLFLNLAVKGDCT